MRVATIVGISLLVVSSIGVVGAAPGNTVSAPAGTVRVIDGDTIEVAGRLVQLYGIDAPELGQVCMNAKEPWHCGIDAARALQKMISVEGAKVRCREVPGESRMFTAVCLAGTVDLARDLVASGQVVALPGKFADYVELQRSVKRGHLGVWRGAFVQPREWRLGKRLPGEDGHRAKLAACPVKATVDDTGRKLYHVPTDPTFDAIKLSPARGDRCFLSDEEARADGWSLAALPPGARPDGRRGAPL